MRRSSTLVFAFVATALALGTTGAGCAVGLEDNSEDAGRPAVRRDAMAPTPTADSSVDEPDAAIEPRDGGTTPDANIPDAMLSACAQKLAATTFNFDAGLQGFTTAILDGQSGTSWPFDPWSQGTAANGALCRSGACFAAELSRNYAQCQRGALVSPVINLSTCSTEATTKLSFYHTYDFKKFTYGGNNYADGGIIELSGDGGATWQLATPATSSGTVAINPNQGGGYACLASTQFGVNGKAGFTGTSATYTQVVIDIPAALRTANFRFRFAMSSGVSSQTISADTSRAATGKGWRIDDIGFSL